MNHWSTCANCDDIVVQRDTNQTWTHLYGIHDSMCTFLNRCQHTVPYGVDATPTVIHTFGKPA